LVGNFRKYGSTCKAYCESFGRQCVGAWEEHENKCRKETPFSCDDEIDTNEAICQCAPLEPRHRQPPSTTKAQATYTLAPEPKVIHEIR
jgi:hypothetical protein